MHNYWSDPYTTQTTEGPNCVQYDSYWEGCWVEFWVDGNPEYYWDPYCEEVPYCVAYEQIQAYDPYSAFRGNVTKITSYADAVNLTEAIVNTKQYDVTGNPVAESSSCCELITYDFNINTQYAYPTSVSRGDANPSSPIRNTSSSTYDFNTGLPLTSTDPNGRTSSTTYDANTLRPTQSTSSTGAYSQVFYDDNAMTITNETREYGGNLAGKSINYLNGIGKIKRTDVLAPGNIWDIVETKYDNLGQVWKQSNPYRTGGTIYWGENVYDILGRTTQIISPDGSTT